jgi:UDP-glucose 4-epimerase
MDIKPRVLVTGGAGYIGSHACVQLIESGYDIVVVDNLSNSSFEAVRRIRKITNSKVPFYRIDMLDKLSLQRVFNDYKIDSVIHFAGLKAVGESVKKPLSYYSNNVGGTIILLELMDKYKVDKLVFSSSCCVYGNPKRVPISERSRIKPINPYGRTKAMNEQIIIDYATSNARFKSIILRYFNPVGAHSSGLIGEDPNGIPNNLMPFISKVAVGKIPKLKVFGGDYKTRDGTGVRDYIHITDLIDAHIKALARLEKINGVEIFNIGTGRGYSVLEVIAAFEKASGKKIPYEIVARRKGDSAIVFADPSKANRLLGWKASKDLSDMCESVWRWQKLNPNGYR